MHISRSRAYEFQTCFLLQPKAAGKLLSGWHFQPHKTFNWTDKSFAYSWWALSLSAYHVIAVCGQEGELSAFSCLCFGAALIVRIILQHSPKNAKKYSALTAFMKCVNTRTACIIIANCANRRQAMRVWPLNCSDVHEQWGGIHRTRSWAVSLPQLRSRATPI